MEIETFIAVSQATITILILVLIRQLAKRVGKLEKNQEEQSGQ